jgi:hypothetical protein
VSFVVLLVGDVRHPLDQLAVERLLDGDVRHGRGWRGAVPVLLAGPEPDHVAGMDRFDWAAFPLDSPAAGRDDQGLAERVRVLGSPGAGLERHTGTGRARRVSCLKQRIDADRAGEPLGRARAGRLRAASPDVHF